MTHDRSRSDLWPIPPATLKGLPNFDVELRAHAPIIAKFCDIRKHHIASADADTSRMEKKPVNQVVAEALTQFMGAAWNNVSLARASGVAEATIRNYRSPVKRSTGTSGKAPSAKLSELELLADALGVTVADLVTDATPEARRKVHRQRAADYYRDNGRLPSWAPATPAQEPASVSRTRNAA